MSGSTALTIADVKEHFEMVSHWRTFTKYFHPQWGYCAVSESRNLLLGPCHDAKSMDGAIAGFHATKRVTQPAEPTGAEGVPK